MSQRSVADFTPSRAAHAARLAHAEGREVVVQHEGVLLFALVRLQPLAFVGGAQGGRNQGLGLAAGEQRRAVRARQNAVFNGDGANLVEGAAIGPDALLGDLLAEDALAQMLVVVSQLLLGIRIVGGQSRGQLVLDRLDQRLAFQLVVRLGVQRVLDPVANLGLQLGIVGFVELRRREGPLGLAGQGDQLVDGGDDLLDLHVSKLDGRQNDLFGLFLGARLDHHDAVLVADDHNVDRG